MGASKIQPIFHSITFTTGGGVIIQTEQADNVGRLVILLRTYTIAYSSSHTYLLVHYCLVNNGRLQQWSSTSALVTYCMREMARIVEALLDSMRVLVSILTIATLLETAAGHSYKLSSQNPVAMQAIVSFNRLLW